MRAALAFKVVASAQDHHAKAAHKSAHLKASPAQLFTRRDAFLAAALAAIPTSFAVASPALAVPVPPPPSAGDCPDCIGAVNNTLNACSLNSQSCTSTLNDDEMHFAAPWQYDSSTDAAVQRLIEVATGGEYEPGLIKEPFGISKGDAAGYIAKGVLAVMVNGEMPERPKVRRQSKSEIVPFDGVIAERRTTENGSEYVRVTLGVRGSSGQEVSDIEDPVSVIDAEFLFLKDDNIVNVRAASRVEPPESGLQSGELAISFTSGLVVDKNVARRKLESLRTALRWDLAPVLTDFDPKFNPDAPVWLEKVFKPFDDRNNFKPSGVAYPVE